MRSCKLAAITTAAALLSAVSALAAPSAPARLGLDEYLAQVERGNPSLKSARAAAEGYSLRGSEGTLLTAPFVFANYTNLDDKKETQTPLFQGYRTKVNTTTLGLGANTAIGLSAKYSYNLTKTEIQGASPLQLPQPNFYTAYNQLELSQAILRNGFGSEIRAQETAANFGNRAQAAAEEFRSLAQLVEAENTYWRLAFARKNVEINRDVMARSEKILEWARRRVSMQLGDRSDLLQSEAGYNLRKLELQNALEEEKSAARAFNLLRDDSSQEVGEQLEIPSPESLLKLPTPRREGSRLDLKAAENQEKAQIALAQLDKERVKPQLDVFATIAWNGRDGARPEATSEAFRSNHSTTAIGVKFTAPLALPTAVRTWKGTELAKEAATLNLERKRRDETLDWTELTERFSDARARLALQQVIEKVQKEKFDNERQRLLRGRTTTYQALIFEQDYAQAQQLRIRIQSEILRLSSQLKLYKGEL